MIIPENQVFNLWSTFGRKFIKVFFYIQKIFEKLLTNKTTGEK